MKLSPFVLASATVVSFALALEKSPAMAQPTMPAGANVPGVSAALSASPFYTCVTNVYVDGVNGNDSNPGTPAKPWKTVGNASDGWPNTTVPGECVNVLPGTYTLTSTLILPGGNSNSPTGYVVYRSTGTQGAHLIAGDGINSSANGDIIMLYNPYIIIDGFDIDGNNAYAAGNGIDGCADGGGSLAISHHFWAINNLIHDVGGAGLTSCTADYITWRNNVVYNTSSTYAWQASGMSVYEPKGLAAGSYTPTAWDNVAFGIQIAYNIAYNNFEGPNIVPDQGCTPVPPATSGPPCYHTDGNGIIIDTTFGSATCPTCGTPYPGNVLVVGNVSYSNGGGGIHVFFSENVTVANNTVYNNYLDTLNPGTPRGELSNLGSSNTTWVNNVAIAVPGNGVLSGNKPIVTTAIGNFTDGSTWTRNITFGANNVSDSTATVSSSANLVGVNPRLTSPSTGNFSPLSGSPVVRTGLPERYLLSKTPDIGAY